MTPTASELADALERSAIELEGFYSSRPDADTAPRFADTLRQSVAALRRAEVMRETLKQIAASPGPHDCEAAYWRCDAARQALTGEA
jgi:hypothetical protein